MGHIFKNKLIILLRSKEMIFWTLLFPLALAIFFNMAFSNLDNTEKFQVVKIGVVKNSQYEANESFQKIMKETSEKGKNQIFKIIYFDDEKKAEKSLKENDIEGFYLAKDSKTNIEIAVKKSNITQTIMKQVVDMYSQTFAVVGTITEFNPTKINQEIINDINDNKSYFKDVSNNEVDSSVIYFYTLIGMVCMYAGLFGIEAVKESEANLSTIAARNSIAPTNKLTQLLGSLFAGLFIQYIEILILLAFMILALGVAFGNQTGYIALLALVGAFAGISFGMMIGSTNKRSENTKIGILISVTMLCCVLGGMMSANLRFTIKDNLPVLDAINPITMITDGLYSLYCYSDLEMYIASLIKLGVFSLVMILISYIFVRRKKYDSI